MNAAAPILAGPIGPLYFRFRGGSWELSRSVRLVGILNVTPDSFYDGGRYGSPDRALERAERMVEEGADAIDVGGQSTRPGARSLGPDEEWRRVEPVLSALSGRVGVPLSIDTYHGEVARRALDLGAAMVNDVSGLCHDPTIADHAARAGAGLVLMHALGVPDRIHETRPYEDVGAAVAEFLAGQLRLAAARGVSEEHVALDPGVGFSKQAEQSVAALRAIPRLTRMGRPLYIGVSRKSFLNVLTGQPAEGRLAGSLGAVVASWYLGGRIFRVHDVRETRDALRAAGSILDPASSAPAEPVESRR
ncbi:MAG TPA: dihydropteroate synthase [Candidatus Eisenbacteria bacterium]|jgi:dihydropteroate synthase